ncbi:hypothetical protein BD309DRAFT_995594 [Dichomitus squalens]|nr:hypothetical protein BD309DRAFT_995594 [Dichomitus squalens]
MAILTPRLLSHKEEHAHSYAILEAAREAAKASHEYDSEATWQRLKDTFRQCMGGKALLVGLDCMVIAGTGSGKTMPFVMPTFVEAEKIYFIISPLNALEADQTAHFAVLEVPAVAVNRTTFTDKLLEICMSFIALVANPRFASRIGAFIIGEAHCITQWGGDFQPEYSRLEKFRALVPKPMPFLVMLATITPFQLERTHSNLSIEVTCSFHLNLGNDHPNIKQEVQLMKSASNYAALNFIVAGAVNREDLPCTIIFVNEVKKMLAAVQVQRANDRVKEERERERHRRIDKRTKPHPGLKHKPKRLVAIRTKEQVAVVRGPLWEEIVILHAHWVEHSKHKTWWHFKEGEVRILIATEAAAMVNEKKTIPPSCCCDICAAAASLSTGQSPMPASATGSGTMAVSATAPPPPHTRKGTHLKTMKTALIDWQYTTQCIRYKFSSLKAENILPNGALTTIASLCRDLKTIQDLKRVLNPPWPHVDNHGEELLKIV